MLGSGGGVVGGGARATCGSGGAVPGCGGQPGRVSGGRDKAVMVDVDVDAVLVAEHAGDGGLAMAFWA